MTHGSQPTHPPERRSEKVKAYEINPELVEERNQLKARVAELEGEAVIIKSALRLVQEQEKRGYLSYCGVFRTKEIVDSAISGSAGNPYFTTLTHYESALKEARCHCEDAFRSNNDPKAINYSEALCRCIATLNKVLGQSTHHD